MLLHVLIALLAVVITGQIISRLLARIGQPPVIGEVLAGILLGPSLIGVEWSARILPPAVAPALGLIAGLGVVFYMFLVGLDLQLWRLRQQMRATLAIALSSMVVPFALGVGLAVALSAKLSPPGVSLTSFTLFLGVAMSITAFPVLARILTDRNLTQTQVGSMALSAAAIGDVIAWCLLAVVVGVVQAQVGQALLVTLGAVVYILFMLFVARPAMRAFVRSRERLADDASTTALMFTAVLLSAVATEAIGIHAIFGAFLLGAIVPPESAVAVAMTRQLKHVVTVLLLPAFFAFTGMRTRIDLVNGTEAWLLCGLIILLATIGKVGGAMLAARFTGFSWRDATTLGALMNTRGLMELIVLNIGLELGVISPALFSMMVLMALATTMMAGPVLSVSSKRS